MELININDMSDSSYVKHTIFLTIKQLFQKYPTLLENIEFVIDKEDNYYQIILPFSKQIMLENFAECLMDDFRLQLLVATQKEGGKQLEAILFSEATEDKMFVIYLGSLQHGLIDKINVVFFDSVDNMYLYLLSNLSKYTKNQIEVLKQIRYDKLLQFFNK